MKRLLIILFVVVGAIGISKAQQTQSVTNHSVHKYTANAKDASSVNKYVWELVNKGTGTAVDIGTPVTESIDIGWEYGTGDFELSVYILDNNSCSGEKQIVNITVAGEASVMFAAASLSSETCSDLDGGLSGGGLDESEFQVKFTDGVAPFSLIYQIENPDGSKQTAVTVNGLDALAKITINNNFVNESGADAVYKVAIVSATTKDGMDVSVDGDLANNTRTITVHTKPVVTIITLD